MGLGKINSQNFTINTLIIAALLTAFTAALAFSHGKDLPDIKSSSRFQSQMLELQLASSEDEVLQVLGSSPGSDEIRLRKKLNLQNFYDSFFLFCYPVFVALVFLFFYKSNRNTPYRELIMGLGLSLCFFMLLSDLYENTLIYKITSVFSEQNLYETTLNSLIISSRVKFASLFLSCLVMAGNYIIYSVHKTNTAPVTLLYFFAAFYMISGLSGYFSIVIKSANFFVENCMVYVAVCWLLTLMHIVTIAFFKKKKITI